MPTLPIGTVVTKFSNTFILTDPQYIQGLELWRQVVLPPAAEDIHGIAGVLPIVTRNSTTTEAVNVSFDIGSLASVFANTGVYTPKNKAFAQLQNGIGTAPTAPGINAVNTILPINSVKQSGLDVLYFDIESLEQMTLSKGEDRAQKYKVAVKPYNVNSSVQITSDLPMVDEVNGDVATFSFDITDLNYV